MSQKERKRRSRDDDDGGSRREDRASKRSRTIQSTPSLDRNLDYLIPLFTCAKASTDLDSDSEDIYKYYKKEIPSAGEYRTKFRIWSQLVSTFTFNSKDPRTLVMIFGSSLNGLARKGSDLDISIYCPSFNNQLNLLSTLRKWLRVNWAEGSVRDVLLIPAKVPILKFTNVSHSGERTEVDISCNDPTGIPWAANYGINDAKDMTLSSFTLLLMLIHYLQIGVSPPVLPVVQDIGPSYYRDKLSVVDIFNLPYKTEPDVNFTSSNSMNCFDFTRDVGSIRTGKRLDSRQCQEWARHSRGIPRQWEAYVLMEEPFNRSNSARSTVNREKFDSILVALKEGHRLLVRENASLAKFLSSN
ncbi:PAPD4 [Lepeophtheirus salmonis]|uniref:PAPD4 n=1 Tax=Lepeophtheirus salmonis TaxID=72036 RepID=A0A7R8D4Z1_LEPSM|nr:PAPD4 [Lepeophtheirus salmonis]CAF3025780.1 PAPD4 [Lepeophtheirus salmonis]